MKAAIIRAISNRPRRRQHQLVLALATVLAAALLSVTVGIFVVNTRHLDENHRLVLRTIMDLRALQDVFSMMRDGETGQRGYVITGKDEYLEPYSSAMESIPKSLDALGLGFDELGKSERFNVLKSEIQRKLGELRETIALRRDRGFDAAAQVVLADRGKRSMDRIRDLINEEITSKRLLLARRTDESETILTRLFAAFVVSTIAALVVLTSLAFLVWIYLKSRERAEVALWKSEERQRMARNATRIAHWEWDIQTDRIVDTESLALIYGRSDERPFLDLADYLSAVHPDDRHAISEGIKEALAENVPYEAEVRVVWPDGSVHWLIGRATTLCSPEGAPVGMVGMNLDITERKDSEARIRLLNEELERRFGQRTEELGQRDRLIDQAQDAIMVRSPEGVISSWNRGAERLYGWTRGEAVGRVSHEILKTRFPVPLAEIEGELASMGTWAGELIHRRRDGASVVVASRMVLDRDGSVDEAVLEINSDVTERNLAIERLKDSDARTAAILDCAVDAILTIDEGGLIESLNPAAERLFGYPRAGLIGENIKVLMPEPYHGEHDGYLANYRDTGVRKIIGIGRDVVGRRQDGTTFPMQLAVGELRLGDRRMFTGIARDITEREKAEGALRRARDEAMAASRAKSDFLANMSHEIRTPMNGVIGMTDLLLDTPLNDLQRDYARTVQSSGEALLTVINEILDFSKIEAGKLTLVPVEFDLRALMGEVAALLAAVARKKDLELICRVAREVPGRLVGDPIRIRQILTNLAGNAVKFTDRGEVTMEARLLAEDGDRMMFRILVSDTGIGIPEGRQADIFESFTQIEGGDGRPRGGTGLGLTICRSLVALMGGRIGLESRIGAGSTFWFEVAFARGHVEADPSTARLDGLRVLVVASQQAERETLDEWLLSWKCRTELVASGAEALARLLADPDGEPFGLILLDQDMPGMDGEQTARVIRSVPRSANLPLVQLISPGQPGGESAEGGLWAARLSKPAERSLLHDALRRAVYANGSPDLRPTATDPEVEEALPPLRILLAEDNEVNRRVAIGMLERLGCNVEAAGDGREALETLDYDRHDLILMDVQMPGMDGLAATAAIRDRESGTDRHIPIVAMTAFAMQGDRERCLAAGADSYVSKPIRPGPLREALRAGVAGIERPSTRAGQGREPELPSFSSKVLGEMCGDNQKLMREVLEIMLRGFPAQLGRLEAAVVAGDGRQRLAQAHSLGGAFASVGAVALAATCEVLMTLGEDGDPAAIEAAYGLIRDQGQNVRREANFYLDTLRT